MCLIAVFPEQDEFRYQVPGELCVDISQPENIVYIFSGSPIVSDALWLGIVFKCRAVAGPLATDMGNKLGIPSANIFSTLTPIQYKFGNGVVNKLPVYLIA